jgi:hypothetical protein
VVSAARVRSWLRPALGACGLALVPFAPFAPRAGAQVVGPVEPRVLVYLIPGASFERLLAVPEVRALARTGGAGLMSLQGGLPESPGDVPASGGGVSWRWLDPATSGGPAGVGAKIRADVEAQPGNDVLVVVASTVPSAAMVAAKDDLHPVVIARGAPGVLFREGGGLRTLASDTTRRTGVVTDADVRATILQGQGRAVPESLGGLPVRFADDPAPFTLHERYLAMRRLSVPIGTAAGLYVTAGGLFGIAVLAWRQRTPRRLGRAAAWVAMSVPIMATALLAAGHLSTLSYATVVPFVIAVTAGGILAVAPLARRDVLLPPAAIGFGVLAYFLVEALLGWTAAQTTLLGGSELDGGRFFGLPNVFIGLLLGSSLYIASRLRPLPGFALVAGVGLFAGLPFAGSNLGAAVSLFAAAGLWLVLRTRSRLGWRELAMAGGLLVAGTAVVLLAHRFLTSTPTHVTRFEEAARRNLADVWHTFADRLALGWRLLVRNPFAVVPVLGIPATLAAVLRPPGPVREPLARHPVWRDALLVLLLAGVVAILANDSWPAAVGLAFGLGLGGLIYVSLIDRTWKMEGT